MAITRTPIIGLRMKNFLNYSIPNIKRSHDY